MKKPRGGRKAANGAQAGNVPKSAHGSALPEKGASSVLAIEDLADTGEGVGRADGFALFVKDAVPGDTVEVTVIKVKSRYGYAHLERIVTPSPDRVTPPCPVARACGGCQIQAYAYPAALAWKERRVRDALVRIGGVSEGTADEVMLPIAGADAFRYRNKAQFPVAPGRDGRPIAGFYAARTHCVIPVDDCLLGDPVFSEIQRSVLAHMEQRKIPAYDERTGAGILRHILIRRGHHSGQIGVTLVVNAADEPVSVRADAPRAPRTQGGVPTAERLFPGVMALADELFAAVDGMASLSLNVNAARTNVILGRTLLPVRGDLRIEDSMCGLRFRISPLSFYQVNTAQAERLYEQAMAFAGLTGTETVVDLYCGIGTITLLAARCAARVVGVEVVPDAIEDARENAALNGLDNVSFCVGQAEDVLPALVSEGLRADVLIVDPPRAGLASSCVDAIRALAPSRIVYVSCNPATLARDIGLLTACYRLENVRAFDLFPQTVHVETVCILSKLSAAKEHIEVTVDMDELDLTSAEAKATYNEIRDWVQEHYGMYVTNLNIAQVKQKHGIIERENYNKPKSPDSKQPGCPEEKIKAIEDAMRHFQMI